MYAEGALLQRRGRRSSRPVAFVLAGHTMRHQVVGRTQGHLLCAPRTSKPSPDRLGLSGRGQVGLPLHCATPGPHNPWDCSHARRCPFSVLLRLEAAFGTGKPVALVELGSHAIAPDSSIIMVIHRSGDL